MKKIILLFVGIIALTFANTAFALQIDFTDASKWSAADGKNSYTADYGNLSVKASALPLLKKLSYQTDGMGVSGWIGGDDEIGLKEMISLSFFSNLGELKSVLISSFTVSDLFENEFFCADEEGGFKYSPGGLPTIFSPADGDYNPDGGILTYHFDQPVAAANFTFFGVKSLFGWKDFAIQSLDLVDVASVPEPATMLLFGTGLIGIAGVSRKKFLR